MRTMGELYDALKNIEGAENDVDTAERRVANCHPVNTLKAQEQLKDRQAWLEQLRNELIDPPDTRTELQRLRDEEIQRHIDDECAHTDYRE